MSSNKHPAISVQNVSKDFKLRDNRKETLKSKLISKVKNDKESLTVQSVLHNVSLDINEGEFFGIVGRNGSGKSTLLKLLAGIYQPTKGKVGVRGRLVPFIELGVGFNPELSGRDNVYLNGAMLGFSEAEIDQMYEDIVDFAELEQHMDKRLKNYSSGMQVRLAFSMAVRADADVLLIDEVLAVGDSDFQRKCFSYFKKLKREKKTVVFVTHDMSAVREYCDRAVVIDQGEITHIGTPNDIAAEYEKLFINTSNVGAQSGTEKRWGTGEVKYSNPEVEINDKRISITLGYKSDISAENIIFGVQIKDEAGTLLLGTNTNILGMSSS